MLGNYTELCVMLKCLVSKAFIKFTCFQAYRMPLRSFMNLSTLYIICMKRYYEY